MPIADIVAQKKEAAIQEIVTKQQAKDQLEDQAHTLVATTNATNTVLTAYLAYTGLPPSQPDLTTWVDFLVKGGSTTTLIATLAKNPAYLANTAGSAVNAVQYAFHNRLRTGGQCGGSRLLVAAGNESQLSHEACRRGFAG